MLILLIELNDLRDLGDAVLEDLSMLLLSALVELTILTFLELE